MRGVAPLEPSYAGHGISLRVHPDGDMHTRDAAALYEATGAIALCVSEGVPCAVIKGQGVVSLHKLFSDNPTVRAIK